MFKKCFYFIKKSIGGEVSYIQRYENEVKMNVVSLGEKSFTDYLDTGMDVIFVGFSWG